MKVDMSPEAVTARLKLASQLRRLCLALGKARPVKQPAVGDAPTIYERTPQSTDERVSARVAEPTVKGINCSLEGIHECGAASIRL
jgi:hypothetical protein